MRLGPPEEEIHVSVEGVRTMRHQGMGRESRRARAASRDSSKVGPPAGRAVVVILGAIVACAWMARAAGAQVIRPDLCVTDGTVQAIAKSGSTLYIGGQFNRVGPATGGGVPLDVTSGMPVDGFPKVAGVVSAVASDGAGGWYVGGEFATVGGIPRSNIAHVLADNTVSAWAPNPDQSVAALVVSGTTVYVSGSFSSIGGEARNHLAALDATTGLATSWNPDREGGYGGVGVLAVNGSTVYVNGDFTSIGGQARNYVAALDATTGLATGWDPDPDNYVATLVVSATTVYAGGGFTSIGGQARNHLAALDATTGLATLWDPNLNGDVSTLAASESTVYASGSFVMIATHGILNYATSLVAFDVATGLPRDWNCFGSAGSMALNGTTLYLSGSIYGVGGGTRDGLAAVDAATGTLTAWDPPQPNYPATVMAAGGTTVYVGGGFTSLGGVARNSLAALDLVTGLPTEWNPDLQGSVCTLALSGSTLYVGGAFRLTFPVPNDTAAVRTNLAAFDLSTGQPTIWNPNGREWVGRQRIATLAASGSTVYVGGRFTSMGGQTRNCIAALNGAWVDSTTAMVLPWNPSAYDSVSTIVVSGNTVYVAGTFTRIGGQTRNGLAALDATAHDSTDGIVASWWDPNPWPRPFGGWPDAFGRPPISYGPARALAVSGSTVYVGGSFEGFGEYSEQPRFGLAALDAGTGLATAWNPGLDRVTPDPGGWGPLVSTLAVTSSTVYAGGYFAGFAGQQRRMLAALDATTGLVMPWKPEPNGAVLSVLLDGTSVYAGGSFSAIGGQPQSGIAAMGDLTTPVTLSLVSADAVPGRVQLTWYSAAGGVVTATVYRRTATSGWTAVATVAADGTGRLAYEDTRVTAGARYGYRLGVRGNGGEAFFAETWVDVPRALELSLQGARPNPALRELWVSFALPTAAPATLSLFDLAGRRVRVRDVGSMGAGEHRVRLDEGGSLAAGIYVVRLAQAARTLTRQVTVIR